MKINEGSCSSVPAVRVQDLASGTVFRGTKSGCAGIFLAHRYHGNSEVYVLDLASGQSYMNTQSMAFIVVEVLPNAELMLKGK